FIKLGSKFYITVFIAGNAYGVVAHFFVRDFRLRKHKRIQQVAEVIVLFIAAQDQRIHLLFRIIHQNKSRRQELAMAAVIAFATGSHKHYSAYKRYRKYG